MLQILREFSDDPVLSSYVIDDIWDDMKAMKVYPSILIKNYYTFNVTVILLSQFQYLCSVGLEVYNHHASRRNFIV
jgi:hypothetical protein